MTTIERRDRLVRMAGLIRVLIEEANARNEGDIASLESIESAIQNAINRVPASLSTPSASIPIRDFGQRNLSLDIDPE
jgi:hypothetical protein